MSTKKAEKFTSSDIQHKSFLMVLMDEMSSSLFEYSYHNKEGNPVQLELTLSELSQLCDDPVKVFNIVKKSLIQNDEVLQSMAHLKISSRQPTSFDTGGRHFFEHVDMMFFDVQLIDAIGFSNRETCTIFYEELKGYGRWLSKASDIEEYGKKIGYEEVEA